MAMFNFLRGKGRVRVPLTPDEAREQGSKMPFRREWECACGATLKIRAEEDRQEGHSNYVPFPSGHPLEGHSQIRTISLNWNGLAEERGWGTDPVKCPACRAGMSVKEYKEAKRTGNL